MRALAERVARTYGLEIFDVQFRREAVGWVLRVTIDRQGAADTEARPGAPADSVGVDDCRHVSSDLSAVLDVEDVIDRAYTLEVTSPGLDRPLRHAGDYSRFPRAPRVAGHGRAGGWPDALPGPAPGD